MPTVVKQTLDPKLLTSKGLDASNFQSKKTPIQTGSLLGYLEKTGQIKTPWVQSVIKPVQEIMKPMSQELPVAPASRSLPNWQPILASTWMPQRSETQKKWKLSIDDFAQRIKEKYPEYKDVDNNLLTTRILDKYPEYQGKVDTTWLTTSDQRYDSNLFEWAADYYQNDVMWAIKASDNVLVNNPITRSLAWVWAMWFKWLRDVTQWGGELLDKWLAQVWLWDKKYKWSTVGENLYDIGQWAVNTLATAYAPVAVTAVWAGIQSLPENAQKAVWEVMWDVGWFISKAPWLKQRRESLPIDRRQEFDNEVAWAAIWLLTGLKGKKNIIKDPKLFLKQNLNPVNIAKNFQENVLNLPANAVWTAKAIPWQLVKAGDKIKNIEAPKWVKKAINQSIEQLQWISKAQKQWLENNPFTTEYLPQVLKKIDSWDVPANLKDLQEPYLRETVNKIDKLLDERKSIIGEEWQAYKLLRSDPTIIDTKSMVREMNDVLKWTDYNIRSFLNKVDQWNLLWTREILKWESLTSTIHDVRKSIDRLMEKAKANKDSWEYQVLQKMRWIVDNQLKSNPQWRQADEIFKQEIDIIKEIEEWITYREARRQWQFRDNIDNIIANINQPAKAQLKERLSKYMPDLAERIEAISQIPQIAKAYTSVPTWPIARTIWAAAWWAIWWASMWLPWAIVWIVWWFFTDIALTSARRKAIVDAVNKVWPKATQRLSNLMDEIKNLEEVDSNKIKQIKSHIDEISSRVNDPELKAQMKKITEDKIRQKIKTRSIVPLKEWQLKNNPATAMIYPKKPVVNVIEKWVANKPWTTKINPQAIVKKSEVVKQWEIPVIPKKK